MKPVLGVHAFSVLLAGVACAAQVGTYCQDPPCTPDVLLFGSFNGSSANITYWSTQHDPHSSAQFSNGGFSGRVAANGFAVAGTALLSFPSTYGCRGLVVSASSTPDSYSGYTLSFGTGEFQPVNLDDNTTSYHSPGYKANFSVGGAVQEVYLDLTDFSRDWLKPGQQPSPDCHHDTSVCPTFMQMQNLQKLQVWAEAVPGNFRLDIQSIRAASCYQPGYLNSNSNSLGACYKTCGSDDDCSGCGFCYPAPHSCCSAGVSTPLDCPNSRFAM